MKAIADICIIPLGIGISVSRYIAECERIFTEVGLDIKLHAYGTNVEGEFDQVINALKRCHEHLHSMGVPRISSSVRIGTRIDRNQTMNEKIGSVETKLGSIFGGSNQDSGNVS